MNVLYNRKISNREFHDTVIVIGFKEVIDEVSIEQGLQGSGNKRCKDDIFPVQDPTLSLTLPVKNIEYAVHAQKENIVSGNVLNIFQTINHEELGEDGNGLQPNAKAPDEIDRGE